MSKHICIYVNNEAAFGFQFYIIISLYVVFCGFSFGLTENTFSLKIYVICTHIYKHTLKEFKFLILRFNFLQL